ncbi:hypothetical protein A8B78_22260 [Jannaschia sp. EhC01]|nr:hypothetical protein A8B78_22260 [Jannaschia sp. EhC01]
MTIWREKAEMTICTVETAPIPFWVAEAMTCLSPPWTPTIKIRRQDQSFLVERATTLLSQKAATFFQAVQETIHSEYL